MKRWSINKPQSLQIGEWEDWHTNMKSKHPFAYWVQETAVSTIDYWWDTIIYSPIKDCYWWGMHRFHPNHQYSVCKPRTLTPGYHDSDERMLHSVMEEVTSFYETGCNYIEWRESSDMHAHAYNELERVYLWWTELWPLREERSIWGELIPNHPDLPTSWGFMAAINEKYRNEPIVAEWSRIARIRIANENDWDEMENEMIKRIISIRQFMWH